MKKLVFIACAVISAVSYGSISDSDKELVEKSSSLVTNKITSVNAMEWFDYGIIITNKYLINYTCDLMTTNDRVVVISKLIDNGNIDFIKIARKLLVKLVDSSKGKHNGLFIRIKESELLPLFKKAYNEGKYDWASLGFLNIWYSKKYKSFEFISSERLEWCNSVALDISKKMSVKIAFCYGSVIRYLAGLDNLNGTTIAYDNFREDMCNVNMYFITTYPDLAFKNWSYYSVNGTSPKNLYNYALQIDKLNKNKNAMIQVYPRLVSMDFNYAFNAALYLEDVDRLIELLMNYKGDLLVSQVTKIIEPLNAVDADYRKADILTILKNINSKYTIKLYDNQKEWEPIIAKIRAMIDVRK